MKLKIITGLFLFAGFASEAAQVPLEYTNKVYEADIKTVILQNPATTDRFPMISLNSNEQLNLQFDELKSTNDYYQYSFIHCNASWEPSNLDRNQYISGRQFAEVNDFNFSIGTINQYTHYSFSFPQEDMKPKYSGNYLLVVYRNFDETDIVITRRFMVSDLRIRIEPTLKQASPIDLRNTHQEIDFVANLNGYSVPNPGSDLNVQIMQNYRWDNLLRLPKPMYISGQTLNYDFQQGNNFAGANEFRFFDIRSLRRLSFNVRNRYNDENGQKHVVLNFDGLRAGQVYQQIADNNGNLVIDNKDNSAGGEDAGDYCWVHFTLYAPKPYEQDVYVLGELSDWQKNEDFKMTWNATMGAYELVALVKQAYVNYMYVLADPAAGVMSATLTEGDHFDTENVYHIMVYHRNQGMFYDELIGAEVINSRTLRRQ